MLSSWIRSISSSRVLSAVYALFLSSFSSSTFTAALTSSFPPTSFLITSNSFATSPMVGRLAVRSTVQ
ncbi:unnamed protein product, partial [Closterium sp. NIES-65]